MRDKLTARQQNLSDLAQSFQRFWTFAVEIRRVSRRKQFDVQNALLWDALHALHRMLVIDLADWVDHLRTNDFHTGWFRKHLQGDALSMLRNSKRLARKQAGDRHPYWERQALEHRREALKRLFGPGVAARGKATANDVLRLERKLERWSRDLRNWRNVQAHRLESIDAKKLRLPDLAKRFQNCGRLMNDLRLLIDNTSYGMPSLEPSERSDGSRDLADLLVVGDIEYAVGEWTKEETGEWLWQKRDAHYLRMHARRRKKKTASFNIRPE